MSASSAALRAARQFASGPGQPELEPLGRGLINDTYRVRDGRDCWVLQRINRRVFTDPAAVMANLRRISEHARRVRLGCPDTAWRLPEVIPTRSGDDLFHDAQGEYWRAISYIDQTHGLSEIGDTAQAEQVGRAIGWFHGLLAELPAEALHDTLPGFHVTPAYLARYDAVRATAPTSTDAPGLAAALLCVDTYRDGADVLEQAREQGRLRPRVIHGDPKLDNVLFDNHTGQAVSLVDLDTVKPGLLHYDLGDCLRSCCNRAGECSAPAEASFDLEVFKAILSGYHHEAPGLLTRDDREYLFEAIRLLPFELGLRFLTDHLAGDCYFKVHEPGQNLTRALAQFSLVASIERQAREIRRILAALA